MTSLAELSFFFFTISVCQFALLKIIEASIFSSVFNKNHMQTFYISCSPVELSFCLLGLSGLCY